MQFQFRPLLAEPEPRLLVSRRWPGGVTPLPLPGAGLRAELSLRLGAAAGSTGHGSVTPAGQMFSLYNSGIDQQSGRAEQNNTLSCDRNSDMDRS